MGNERPKIKVPFEPVDFVIEGLSIIFLCLMWIYVGIEYSGLEETIPSHFNGRGEIDGYSNKSFIWFLPLLATGMYVLLFILNRYPHMHNYMVNITEENALRNYRFSTRILRIVNFLCTFMFAYIVYQMINSAKTGTSQIGMGFLITVVVASIILPIVLIVYQSKMNKKGG